jgi:hypothetical protein
MTETEIKSFIEEGFVRIESAFARETADAARALLWAETGCDSNDSTNWKKAVVRLGEHGQRPFSEAVNVPILHDAFNSLVGKGRWLPPRPWLGSGWIVQARGVVGEKIMHGCSESVSR